MSPFFSVVIPTYRRADLLRKCVESVLRQSFTSFEVIVSDDERTEGEAWSFLQEASRADGRIRAIRNEGPRGQSANTNNGVRHADGTWIKLLHDDDALYPECLERFHAALVPPGTESAVSLACCRNDLQLQDGRVLPWKRKARQSPIEVLDRLHTPLAMYLQQDVGGHVPSCLCVNSAIMKRHEAYMPSEETLVSSVDTLWGMDLSRHGNRLIINESLVLKRDEPVSVTGGMTDEAMDREFAELRKLQLEMIPSSLNPPSYEVAVGALWLRQGLHRLIKRRSPREALRLFGRVRDPRSLKLAMKMARGIEIPRERRGTT